MKNNIVITAKEDRIYYGYFKDGIPIELYCSSRNASDLIGNIYVGRVDKIADGISGAFVEIGEKEKCFYPMKKNRQPYKLSPGHEDKLYSGDLILLQITKDSAGKKLPVASDNISLDGSTFILTLSDKRLSVSKKIHDSNERTRLLQIMKEYSYGEFGLIARTNANGKPEESLRDELEFLINEYKDLIRKAVISPGKEILYRQPPHYLSYYNNFPEKEVDEIVTEDLEIYQKLKKFYSESEKKIRHYNDNYSLYLLYRFEHYYEMALGKQVMLPSGGFLFIEHTEAMTIIDVNSGAVIKNKKNSENIYYKTNLEATKEIAKQLRLRNISGIIVVDFINMKSKEMQEKLLHNLQEECDKDRIKVKVIDITALGLVELTRDRTLLPLREQWEQIN